MRFVGDVSYKGKSSGSIRSVIDRNLGDSRQNKDSICLVPGNTKPIVSFLACSMISQYNMTDQLPAEFDLEDVESYLRGLGLSEKNVKNDCLPTIRKLVTGTGVSNRNKDDLFYQGIKVTPRDDLEEIRESSRRWLPRQIDGSNGYLLHAIAKLIYYKKERLLGENINYKLRKRHDDTTNSMENDSLESNEEEHDDDLDGYQYESDRTRHCLSEDNDKQHLYCDQWMNIFDGKPTPAPYYKIGKGNLQRAYKVHGQNPMKFPVIEVWRGIGFLETAVHDKIRDRRLELGGGKEWFNFSDVANEDIRSHIEGLIIKALRTND